MTNEDADFLQEEALNQLSRQELQNLGKAHNVKANLKSSTIIARLLEKFPDGVPSSKNDAQPKPSQKTAGAKNKKTLKKEENVFHALERDKFASPSRTSKVRTPKVQTRKDVAPSGSHDIPSDTPALLPGQQIHELSQENVEKLADAGDEPNGSLDEFEYDNLSENSEFDHVPAPSSRGASPQPVGHMPDISYAIDIINANLEEEKKLVLIFMDLRDETAAARRRLQEQYKRLQVEREHRERILSYLTYHVRNNNRWTGDLTTGEEPSEQASEQKKTNNGLGWKDMGQWEFGEIWSGPIVFTDQGEELAPSNTDEYVREVWNNFLRERDRRAAESPVNDDEADAKSPTESTHAEPSLTTSKKRKAISDPSKPFQKRARALSPLSDSDIGPSDLGPFSTYVPPGRTMIWPSESKGKGKMSAKEVKQLEIQKSRIRGLDESDEEDRESTDSF